MKLLWELFWAFFRIGVLTFGGGYAMMPMLQKETIERYAWATQEELLDYFSLGQCLPGIIAVNVATFVGTKVAGLAGAVAAALGVTTPSLVIIIAIAMLLQRITDLSIMTHAFAGIRIAVVALIVHSVLKLSKSSLKSRLAVLIFAGAVSLSVFTNLSPVVIVLASALAGIAAGVVNSKKSSEEAASR